MNRKVLNVVSISAFAVIVMAFMSGCCCRTIESRFGENSDGSVALFETTWKLVQLEGRNIKAADNFRLEFDREGKIAGVGSCNRFFGSIKFTSERGGVSIGPVGSTMMACDDLRTEGRYFRMFELIDTYTIINRQLYLLRNSELYALFDAVER